MLAIIVLKRVLKLSTYRLQLFLMNTCDHYNYEKTNISCTWKAWKMCSQAYTCDPYDLYRDQAVLPGLTINVTKSLLVLCYLALDAFYTGFFQWNEFYFCHSNCSDWFFVILSGFWASYWFLLFWLFSEARKHQKDRSKLNIKGWRPILGHFLVCTPKLSEIVDINPKWCQNTLSCTMIK